MAIKNWSTVADNNAAVLPTTNIAEGMAPSGVNNAMREIIADVRTQWEDKEFFDYGDTVVNGSATTLTITGTDKTSVYTPGRRIRLNDTTTLHGVITDVTYSASINTVTMQLQSGAISTSLSSVALGMPTRQPSIALPPMNLVCGGNFELNLFQRSDENTVVGAANANYVADRIRLRTNGHGSVIDIYPETNAITDAGNYAGKCLTVNTTTAETDASVAAAAFSGIDYVIEGFDIVPYVNQPLVLSFYHAHTRTGIYCVTVYNSGANQNYCAEYSQNAANTWERTSIRIPRPPVGTGTWDFEDGLGLQLRFVLSCGDNQNDMTNNTWQASGEVSTVNQVNTYQTINNKFRLNLLQLQPEIASGMETYVPYNGLVSADLDHQRRYYQSTGSMTSAAYNVCFADLSAVTTAVLSTEIRLPVDMRTTPSVTLDTKSQVGYTATSTAILQDTRTFYINADKFSATGGGIRAVVSWAASAEITPV